MDKVNNILNEFEGWNIHQCDGSHDGTWQIKCNDRTVFNDSNEAIRFVIAKAVVDHSQRHKTALLFIKKSNRREWEKILDIAVNLNLDKHLDYYLN